MNRTLSSLFAHSRLPADRRARGPQAVLAAAMLAVALLSPAAAQAAPTWLSPLTLSAPGQGANGSLVEVDGQGNAVAVWNRFDGTHLIVQAATRRAGGGWSEPQDLSLAGQTASVSGLAVNAQGNAVAVWKRSDGTHLIVQAATLGAGGRWNDPQDLSEPEQDADEAKVGLDAQGNAVAVWRRGGGSVSVVQAATRVAGSDWSKPQTLSAPESGSPQVAVDRHGDAVAVWRNGSGVVQAATRPADDAWTAAENVSALDQQSGAAKVALDDQGNAVAVWVRKTGEFSGFQDSTTVQAATRPAGRVAAWSQPKDVSVVDTKQFSSELEVGVDALGNAVAVWTQTRGVFAFATSSVQAATRPARGDWSTPPQDISPVQGSVAGTDVAVGPQGQAVAVWRRFEGSTSTSGTVGRYIVVGAARGATGGWGAPQDLSSVPDVKQNPPFPVPKAAVDAQGNAAAVWSFGNAALPVQAAGYDAAGPQLRDLSVPDAGAVGAPLSFSVAPVDVWSSVASTRWDFGDGTGSEGRSVSHGYSAPGSYEVTVTSTDSLNNVSSEKRTVVVTSVPTPVSAPPTAPVAESSPAPTAASGPAPVSAGTSVTTPGSALLSPAPAAGFGGTPSVLERSALRRCLAGAKRLKTTRARRKARAACARPGRVGVLKARAASSRTVKLSFLAPSSVGRFAPAARRYVVKQSFKPIRSERAFRAATTLCRRSCSFAPARVGQRLELTVTDLKPRTTYYYAIKAVGAAQRTGPRSIVVKVVTR